MFIFYSDSVVISDFILVNNKRKLNQFSEKVVGVILTILGVLLPNTEKYGAVSRLIWGETLAPKAPY